VNIEQKRQTCRKGKRMSSRPRTLWLISFAFALLCMPLRTAWAQAAATVPDTLEQRMRACAVCHGDKGEGLKKNEYHPRLAGKPTLYLYNQLVNFRDKRREYPIMNYMVAFLSDTYLYEIAEYYAKLAPPYPAPTTRATEAEMALGAKLVNEGDASRKLPSCVSCHGRLLTGLEPAIPGLVGLYPPYISSQLGAWKDNKRHAMQPDCMHDVAQLLTPADIGAITAWLVAQPAPAYLKPAPERSLTLPMECGGLTKK
jgi:cytochrome c553